MGRLPWIYCVSMFLCICVCALDASVWPNLARHTILYSRVPLSSSHICSYLFHAPSYAWADRHFLQALLFLTEMCECHKRNAHRNARPFVLCYELDLSSRSCFGCEYIRLDSHQK